MNTRAVYLEVKKILYEPHIQTVCNQNVPERCFYAGNEAKEYTRTLNDLDLFLSA